MWVLFLLVSITSDSHLYAALRVILPLRQCGSKAACAALRADRNSALANVPSGAVPLPCVPT